MKRLSSYIVILLLLCASVYSADVMVTLRPANNGNWQRNGVYMLEAVVRNNTGAALNLAGVELSCTLTGSNFKEAGVLQVDNFNGAAGNFVVNTLTAITNEITCQKGLKALAVPNYIQIPANSELVIYRYKYRVAAAAVLGQMNFSFKGGTAVVKRNLDGSTSDLVLTLSNGSVQILADTTQPVTFANPASTIINNANYSTGINLNEVSSYEYGDLSTIYYTTNGDLPDTGSNSVVGKIPAIPVNDSGSAQGIQFTLKYFGRDLNGNNETPKSETYTVDIVNPVISNIIQDKAYCMLGTSINLVFKVSETLQANPVVTVGGYAMTYVNFDNVRMEYAYRYVVKSGDAPGTKTISIAVTDVNGNTTADTSKSTIFDFIKPQYSQPLISPQPVKPGDTVTIRFNASEPLDLASTKTKVSIAGRQAVYSGVAANQYTYTYKALGKERTDLIYIQGYDLAGNNSTNVDGWNIINVTGKDIYGNAGSGTAVITLNFTVRE